MRGLRQEPGGYLPGSNGNVLVAEEERGIPMNTSVRNQQRDRIGSHGTGRLGKGCRDNNMHMNCQVLNEVLGSA
jgi:hypothetical protein